MSGDLAPDAPLDQIEWRVQGKIDRGDGVQVVAYLDAPTVAHLLDRWVGPARWRDHYEPAGKQGTLWCHLAVRFGDEWVTKEDLGTASDMEADKGLVSDAFKRVAMRKWGVGRNVFDLPILRITKFRKVERPGKDPQAYLNAESALEIKQRLTALGFEDAAEQTRVAAAEDSAGGVDGEVAPPAGQPDPVDAHFAHIEKVKAGDAPSPAGPAPEGEFYDWRAAASDAGLKAAAVLNAVRKGWPSNDLHRRPNRTADLDRLVKADPVVADEVRTWIGDLAGGAS